MSETIAFSPFDTAAQRFRGTGASPVSEAGPEPWLDRLRDTLPRHDLSLETGYLAWEMTQWQPGLSPEEQAALFMLLVVSLVNLRQGSTRFPVEGEAGDVYLGDMLASLFEAGTASLPLPIDTDSLTRTIQNMLNGQKAPAIIGGPADYKPLLYVSPYVYQQKLWDYESRFAERFTALLDRPAATIDADHLRQVLAALRRHPPMHGKTALKLSAEQEYAVLTAVHSPVTLISGGPGTGKTSIVVFILRLLTHLGLSPGAIALAAPTGKAAQRLGASIQNTLGRIAQPHLADAPLLAHSPVPSTLHRLLGYAPGSGRFVYHEANRLTQQVVIVDEGSMIDLFLMERLVCALKDDAQLIILGDADQLPSVDTGAVLRDLMPEVIDTQNPWRAFVQGKLRLAAPAAAPASIHTPLQQRAVRLQHSYRMRTDDPDGRAILTVAAAINAGQSRSLFAPRKDRSKPGIDTHHTVETLRFRGVEHLLPPLPEEASTALESFLSYWYTQRLQADPALCQLERAVFPYGQDGFNDLAIDRLDQLFDQVERHRILCLTRVYATGAEAINARLHIQCGQVLGAMTSPEFLPGEPLMMQRNDYDKRLFNGDQGLALRVAMPGQAPQVMAVFPVAGAYMPFHLGTLRGQLTLAYAMTVHKSQGSEFDHIALVLPEVDLPLLTRESLYTAVTRSKRSVTILGNPELLKLGVSRRVQRFSGIADKLHCASV